MTTEMLTTEKEANRKAYKQAYQREHYSKIKDTPEFKQRKAEYAKNKYAYKRITIDCSACGTRHKPGIDRCLFIQRERMLQEAQNRIELVEHILTEHDKKQSAPQ